MKKWLDAAKAELDIELDVDTHDLLDLTRVVAHDIARPAAPLTLLLIGYAAAKAGGDEAAVADASRTIRELADRYSQAGEPDAE